MGFFTRTKNAAPREQQAPQDKGKKIILNFQGARGSKAVLDMAAATLEAGGFDPAIAEPKPPEVGDTMKDGTKYAGISPDTGKPMYAMPEDAQQPMEWKEAKNYAKDLDALGHQDWRLPTKGELAMLFNNRAKIGGFNVTGSGPAGWYWSASENVKWSAWCQRFSDGCQFDYGKVSRSSVRSVR